MIELPAGLVHIRTTDVFTEMTVPHGLLRTHKIASDVWGRLVVHAGAVRLVFEDHSDEEHDLVAGEAAVIPPDRPHHVELGHGSSFAVEFHRHPRDSE